MHMIGCGLHRSCQLIMVRRLVMSAIQLSRDVKERTRLGLPTAAHRHPT